MRNDEIALLSQLVKSKSTKKVKNIFLHPLRDLKNHLKKFFQIRHIFWRFCRNVLALKCL